MHVSKRVTFFVSVVLLLLVYTGFQLSRLVFVGTGYMTKMMCSLVFISNMEHEIIISEDIYDPFMKIFLPKVNALKTGDPALEETDIGPLINPGETERVISWIEEAKAQGAEVVSGGNVVDNIVQPTIMEKVKPGMKVSCEEVFGPLVNIFRYQDINEALDQVNDSEFGLQAGLFTNDSNIIFKAFDVLEVGGVIAGDIPTYRIDPMPYGGVKGSGTGREGARFAIEEMTEPKLLVVNQSTEQ